MKRKATKFFTDQEKEMMDTIAVNFIIAQSDGFQLGYAQALSDFVDNIIDYWEGSDDKPQSSVLHTLVDLGIELGKRQETAKMNVSKAKEYGYERYYNWQYKNKELRYGKIVSLFTKKEEDDTSDEDPEEKRAFGDGYEEGLKI